ncbi:MAG: hypothetical protein M5T61_00930 [Acidimicrobiia bacterium]|nr:hypothetical protein [Acidimicrobiia bacterium]
MTSGTRPEPRRSDADEVDAGGLSWEVFVGNLAEVAGSPVESLGYETPLADLVGSGASAVLVKTFIVKTARVCPAKHSRAARRWGRRTSGGASA